MTQNPKLIDENVFRNKDIFHLNLTVQLFTEYNCRLL